MIEKIISEFNFTQLLNVSSGVIVFFIAYLKILPLIPRSANKILSDIDVFNKAKETNLENTNLIKKSIEREINRKYRPPTKIYHFSEFLISSLSLIVISYFLYDRILKKEFDTTFFILLLFDFIALIILTTAFQPDDDSDKKEEIVTERKPVFKFQIFSWSDLFYGIILTIIFGFWTYQRLFHNGEFEFDWWSIMTFSMFLGGIGFLTGAFSREKKK